MKTRVVDRPGIPHQQASEAECQSAPRISRPANQPRQTASDARNSGTEHAGRGSNDAHVEDDHEQREHERLSTIATNTPRRQHHQSHEQGDVATRDRQEVSQARGAKRRDGLRCHTGAATEGEPHHDRPRISDPSRCERSDGVGPGTVRNAPETITPPDRLLRADPQDGVDALMREPRPLVEAMLRSARRGHAAADPKDAAARWTLSRVDAQQDGATRGAEHLSRCEAAVATATPGLGHEHRQTIDRVTDQRTQRLRCQSFDLMVAHSEPERQHHPPCDQRPAPLRKLKREQTAARQPHSDEQRTIRQAWERKKCARPEQIANEVGQRGFTQTH